MRTFDDRLRRELHDAEPPADPSGVVDRVLRKAARRHARHRVGVVVLAFSVVAGSIAGVYGLSRVFREGAPPDIVEPGVSTGLIVVSREIPGEGEHLFAVAPDGSEMRRLTPDGRAVYDSPDVSPDGQSIVVAHKIPSFEPGQSVLATIPIEGGSLTWYTGLDGWSVRHLRLRFQYGRYRARARHGRQQRGTPDLVARRLQDRVRGVNGLEQRDRADVSDVGSLLGRRRRLGNDESHGHGGRKRGTTSVVLGPQPHSLHRERSGGGRAAHNVLAWSRSRDRVHR